MSKKETLPNEELPAIVKAAPELLPVYDWWVKEGKKTLTYVAVAAAIALAYVYGRNYMRSREAKASAALVRLSTPVRVENEGVTAADCAEAAAKYSSSNVGYALKLRLAKRLYEERSFEEALNEYEGLSGKVAASDPFYGFAEMGRAYSLEALGRYGEAKEAFDAVAADEEAGVFKNEARVSALRAAALGGDRDGALAGLAALKEGADDDFKDAVEAAERLVKSYDPEIAGFAGRIADTDPLSQYEAAAKALADEDASKPEAIPEATIPEAIPEATIPEATIPEATPESAPAPEAPAAEPAPEAPAPEAAPEPAPAPEAPAAEPAPEAPAPEAPAAPAAE